MRAFPVLIAILATSAMAAEEASISVTNRIIDEGLNHSQIPVTAQYLTDRIGSRMTNSPGMRAAEKWTQEQYRKWNLQGVHAEGFDFGRGWSIERSEVRMTTPRSLTLRAIPVAWTPATNGTITAPIVVAPLRREADFAKWKGKLKGAIVLISKPTEGSEPTQPAFDRLNGEDFGRMESYTQPSQSQNAFERNTRRMKFAKQREDFLVAEGALAWARESYRDGGLLHGEGSTFRVGETPKLPGVEIAAEDYRKLARLAKAGAAPTLAITSDVRFHDEDHKAYNVFADIPGRDAKAGYVMAGAHLDSWAASDGATDNGAGTVVVMEAARILSTLGLKPKRTIRFALWSGEEQGLLGSLAFVEQHLAKRPPVTDPELAKLSPFALFDQRWPITPLPGSAELTAYFNIDNGSGKVRGLYAEGNPAVVPIFREWMGPFSSMGVTQVSVQPTGGTDHVFMQAVGIPAFQFIQDPLDYSSRTHHSSLDSYDHLKIADLKQAAVVLASMLWSAAERDQPLPRMPVERKPAETNPFNYDDADE